MASFAEQCRQLHELCSPLVVLAWCIIKGGRQMCACKVLKEIDS